MRAAKPWEDSELMSLRNRLRRFLYGGKRIVLYLWVAPATLLGLIGACLTPRRSRQTQVVDGVLEITAPEVLDWLGKRSAVPGFISAITLGHVVLGRSIAALEATRRHERVHVRQYERWGPLFIPVYLLLSAWIGLRGGHSYLDNPFEREAFAIDDVMPGPNGEGPGCSR